MFYKAILLATIFLIGCGLSADKVKSKRKTMQVKEEKLSLPVRLGGAPQIGQTPPQLQFTDKSPRRVYKKLHDWMFSTFPKVRKEPTRISVPSSIAMWLDEKEDVGHIDAFMPTPGSREFTHLHLDGSIHTVVGTDVENEILAKGWGVRHMYYDRGVKEVLVYAPRNEEELDVLKSIIVKSYEYSTGLIFKE